MGLSFSLVLAAAGAVLIWAVNATVSGVNIHAVGVILLIVGLSVSSRPCSSGRLGAVSAVHRRGRIRRRSFANTARRHASSAFSTRFEGFGAPIWGISAWKWFGFWPSGNP